MVEISFSSSFKKSFKKKVKQNKELIDLFWDTVEIFIHNPFDRKLKTHKLSGKLKDLWSFSVQYDLRVIFYFLEDGNRAVFVDIGKHEEVY
jgi:addiction module RelE/StbE family toxin